MKNCVFLSLFLIGLSSSAQVPNYVPTDGLVGYWPFNGNANDESGNGNDAVLQGNASFAIDRYSVANSSYLGDLTSGADITSLSNFPFGNSERTISLWFQSSIPYPGGDRILFAYGDNNSGGRFSLYMDGNFIGVEHMLGARRCAYTPDDNWHNFTVTYPSSGMGTNDIMLYFDGLLQSSSNINPISSLNTTNSFIHWIGTLGFSPDWLYAFSGKLDDIGIWNRALTEQEIQALYIGCSVAPTTIAGSVNPFTLTSSNYACNNNPGSAYEWIVTNGVITAGQGTSNVTVLWGEEGIGTLSVTETNSDGCSSITSIDVNVECSTTAFTITGPLGPNALTETTYTCNGSANSTYQWTISNGVITSGQGTNSVTVLWAGTGLGALSVQETTNANCDGEIISLDVVVIPTSIEEFIKQSIQLFPNPTSDHITVDFGSVVKLNGYTLSIFNPMGQLVYDSNITTQIENFDVNTWGAKGVYQVVVYNPQGVPIETRQIVLQ